MTDAAAILFFWFGELTRDQHFGKDDEVDRQCAERFGAVRDAVLASDAEGWRDDADAALAAIILLDQMSRNIHRGSPRAYEADPLALELSLSAIAAGHQRALSPERRAFLYMPLMHAEDRGVQRFSLRCFSEAGLEANFGFARDHAAVIERFGRYPSRNAALGRDSTAEEREYLNQPGVGW